MAEYLLKAFVTIDEAMAAVWGEIPEPRFNLDKRVDPSIPAEASLTATLGPSERVWVSQKIPGTEYLETVGLIAIDATPLAKGLLLVVHLFAEGQQAIPVKFDAVPGQMREIFPGIDATLRTID